MTEVLNETDYQIDCEEFVRLADFVLSAMHVSTEVELNIIFIDPEPMEELRQAGHSSVEEMLFLATHGMLHLLGYDHAEPAEKEEMFTLQRQLLLSFLAQR